MTFRTILATLVGSLVLAQAGWAQDYPLAEAVQVGDCFQMHLEMNLTGEMRVNKEDKPLALKLEAKATHDMSERYLQRGSDGLPEKSARVYETARAVIAVEKEPTEKTLRSVRSLLVAQRTKDHLLVYSPAGPLTREEADLTNEHFDTLALPGLLPGRSVPVGATWKVPNPIAQALCGFEGLVEQDLVCTFKEVKEQIARIDLTGSATGIDLGALVKLHIDASYQFDLTAKRLTQLDWQQKEERDQGPASPATAVRVTIRLTRTSIPQPPSLSDVALISVPEGNEPPAPLTALEYHDGKGRFGLVYGREWQTVSQGEEHVVLRLLDRGDFVAQVTLTPWKKASKGQHLTPEEFRDAMADTPGWDVEDELQAGEVPGENGRWIYRLSTLGELDGTKVMQNFYLVAGPEGDQVVLAFTLPPKQADRLGSRDLTMAASVEFPGQRPAAEKPKQP